MTSRWSHIDRRQPSSMKERCLSRACRHAVPPPASVIPPGHPDVRTRRSNPGVNGETEGGQGRPQAARRGSLDGPVSSVLHHGRRSPRGLRGRPLCQRGTRAVLPQGQQLLAVQPEYSGAGHLFAARNGIGWLPQPLGSISRSASPTSGGHDRCRARSGGTELNPKFEACPAKMFPSRRSPSSA
jgi:hypothetical protein